MVTVSPPILPLSLGRKQASSNRRGGWHRFRCLLVATIVASNAMVVCEALSAPSSTPSASPNGSGKKIDGISIELFDPSDERTLGLLRDCRRTAFDAGKKKFLDSERNFIAAKSAAEGTNLCAVAFDANTPDGIPVVVGSADLAPKQKGGNVVTNVFVRPDRRGRGIGELLVAEGIEGVLVSNLPEDNKITSSNSGGGSEAILSLDVYTQNKPAFALYQKLGYTPSSPVHSGTLALANALGANLVVSLSKTVPIEEEQQ